MRQLFQPSYPNSSRAIERELELLASEVMVLVEPRELLRKPKSAKQSARFRDREAAFKEDARRQVAELERRKFAAATPVSVQLEIHVAEGGQQPLMPGVVKDLPRRAAGDCL